MSRTELVASVYGRQNWGGRACGSACVLVTGVGAGDGFVLVVRRLVGKGVVGLAVASVVAAAGAAAHAEQPEQSASPGEEHGQPGGDEDGAAERGVDAVAGKDRLEGAEQRDKESGGGDGGDQDKDGGDARDDGGHEAAPAAEDGQEADEQLDDGGDEGDDVRHVHELGHGGVGVQAALQLLGKVLGGDGVVQAPDLNEVEVEVSLRLAARVDVGGVVLAVDASGTVAPQRDGVEVLERHVRLGRDSLSDIEVQAGDAVIAGVGLEV